MRKWYYLLIILIMFLAAGTFFGFVLDGKNVKVKIMKEKKYEKIVIKTEDGISLSALYWQGETPRALILLHMMPATKESWISFGNQMHKEGWHVIAVDLRGHGESVNQGLDYRKFSDAQHQESIKDVYAARQWLVDNHALKDSEIAVGGASIGANLALLYASKFQTPAVFLLSPGIDYRGLKILPIVQSISSATRILAAAAWDDPDSAKVVQEFQKIAEKFGRKENVETVLYPSGGHGTNLFESHPELELKLKQFLLQSFKF